MKNERLGLLLIAASLAVICLVTGLVAREHRNGRRQQVRVQGLALVRLLSRMPLDELVPRGGGQGPLQVVKSSQGDPDFAYAVVAAPGGETLAEVTAPGVVTPQAALPQDPASWLGERRLETDDGRAAREFFAPVLADGALVAHVRLGFFEPGWAAGLGGTPVLGVVALLVFLLTPLSWFLVRREIGPLAEVTEQVRKLAEGRELLPVPVAATGEVGTFIESFNRFVRLAEQRVREVREQQTGMLASSKVLAYQKSRVESVLQTLPDAVVVMDDAGCTSFANARLETLLGVAPEAAVGRKPEEWCPDAEVVTFLSRYTHASSRRTHSDALEFAPEPGSERRLQVSAWRMAGGAEGQGAGGTLVLFRDVTAAALARRAQGEFVTHVAHELKSPLHSLAMHAELLMGKDGESEEFRIEACNVISDEVERLGSLVGTLLSIARIESGSVSLRRQRVRLHDFLQDAMQAVSRGAQRQGLSFAVHVPANLAPIFVDKDLVRVAVNNLLTNAIKYNREGGSVTLEAEETDERVLVRVRDTGLGITEEEQRRVFDKFYRSEREEIRSRGGHGLGLTLAREILALHGGEIELASTPGEGSVFSLVFRKNAVLHQEPGLA
jgi:PAS domain S-box-containing protein